jgi:hypothetical protein
MRSALRNLDTAYAALGDDLRRLIALWPDAESTEQQESANGAQFSSAAAAFVADLDAGT